MDVSEAASSYELNLLRAFGLEGAMPVQRSRSDHLSAFGNLLNSNPAKVLPVGPEDGDEGFGRLFASGISPRFGLLQWRFFCALTVGVCCRRFSSRGITRRDSLALGLALQEEQPKEGENAG